MAVFEPAYQILMKHEGGYLNDPRDHGGETYKGIARKFFPHWGGWGIIDKIKKERKIRTNEVISNQTLELFVRDFYLDKWNAYLMPQVKSQKVANIFFDFIILASSAVAAMQQTLKELGFNIKVDNRMGFNTLKAINAADPALLHDRFKKKRKAYHLTRVNQGKVHSKFLKGWLVRTAGFPDLSGGGALAGLAIIATITTIIIINSKTNERTK